MTILISYMLFPFQRNCSLFHIQFTSKHYFVVWACLCSCDKHTRFLSNVANKFNIFKLQDKVPHITYTHKSHILCTPCLSYRLGISIHNYILTTIWQVHDIFRNMPHLDSYATQTSADNCQVMLQVLPESSLHHTGFSTLSQNPNRAKMKSPNLVILMILFDCECSDKMARELAASTKQKTWLSKRWGLR